MNDFTKTMCVMGVSLSIAMVPISFIGAGLYFYNKGESKISSERIPFNRENIGLIGNDCVIGMVGAERASTRRRLVPLADTIFMIPPTNNIAAASVSVLCMWERTNGHFGRSFSKFFPVFANGVVNTSVVIGACYNREDVPNGATILFSDNEFGFYKDNTRSEIEKKSIYIFIENSDNNYLLPREQQTAVYQIYKKNHREGDSIFVGHNRAEQYNINELYNNIESSEDIDYDYYLPLS